ncbi:peroxisomal targeting signal 1 receptor isoform X2 [Bacillus rossius redtenbacheri]|uniref:peroxisomal targeting signal 1 receptor isoform X2 n=1 Tax=Bacillus rossius redtenbacheri TaxID=93214 RepID=UPI002FDCA096
MPLQDLLAGECGGANPFSRVASHFVKDHGYRDQVLRGSVHHGDSIASPSSEELLQQFLDETQARPQTFHMGSLLQEIREVGSAPPVPGPGVFELAAQEAPHLVPRDVLWAAEFARFPVAESSGRPVSADEGPEMELPALQCNESWLHDFIAESDAPPEGVQLAEERAAQEDGAREVERATDDQQFQYSEFMRFMQQVGDGDVSAEAGRVVEKNLLEPDLERAWSELAPPVTDTSPPDKDVLQSWEQSFYKSLLQDSTQLDGSLDHAWPEEFTQVLDPFSTYQFQQDNPMTGLADALAEGKRKLEAGDVPSAVLCFEAAVQRDEACAEAWLLLGTSQAENEQDCAAIPALKKCLELEPGNLPALLTLATCYTNEGCQLQACQALKSWLQQNPRYSGLVPEHLRVKDHTVPSVLATYFSRDVCRELQGLFVDAARQNPVGTIDPDVQSGLGVLFNLSNEYDKAVDCFRAALQVRRDDFRLWNRLGATLANGNRSEEAVEAYHHALRLSPGFIRARYNLGISCVNLAAYREAAEHLLTALNQQAAGVDAEGRAGARSMSATIWTTLRLVTALLDRRHLYPAVDARDLAVLNKEFGI